jgi:hypothetical protein
MNIVDAIHARLAIESLLKFWTNVPVFIGCINNRWYFSVAPWGPYPKVWGFYTNKEGRPCH